MSINVLSQDGGDGVSPTMIKMIRENLVL